MSSFQRKAFWSGVSGALLPPFLLPPPQSLPKQAVARLSDEEGAGIQADIESLRQDWLTLGDYLSFAITDYERIITKRN